MTMLDNWAVSAQQQNMQTYMDAYNNVKNKLAYGVQPNEGDIAYLNQQYQFYGNTASQRGWSTSMGVPPSPSTLGYGSQPNVGGLLQGGGGVDIAGYGTAMTNLYKEGEQRATDIYGQTAGQARADIEAGYTTGVGDINKALEQLADIYDDADKLLKDLEVDAPSEVALIRGQLERSFRNDFLPQMQDLAQRGALPQGLISKRPFLKQMFESMIPLAGQQLARARDINTQIGTQRAGIKGQYGQGVSNLYTNLAQLSQWKGGALADVEKYKGSGIAGAISQSTSGQATGLTNILGSQTDLAKTMANLQAQLYEINKRYQNTGGGGGAKPTLGTGTGGMTWGGTGANVQKMFDDIKTQGLASTAYYNARRALGVQ